MPTRARARSVPAPRLPLSLRLPNGPPVFVGRERESDALEGALRRGRVASVWGVGGLGKSTLAFHVIHTRFAAQSRRTLMVRLSRDEPIDQALLTVAQALAEIHGATGVDWRALLSDREALVATVIDLADGAPQGGDEAPAHWVLIDDLHHADPARAAEIVNQLARYARRSRWILIGRTRLVPDGALSQEIALGAMTADELVSLGQRWGLEEPIDARIVAAAAGSPWRLGQLLAGVQPGIEPGTEDVLAGLPRETATFLFDLSLVEGELPEATLGRFTALPPADALAGLERRGLIERRPRGLRLHDVARGLLGSPAETAPARRIEAARALCEDPEPRAWLEGLRLLVGEGEATRAARELDARGEAQIAAGQVLGVWRVLERATAPELASWRLRCATEISDPPVLRGVAMPPSPSAADRMRWALSLLQQARHEEAVLAGAEAQAVASAAGEIGLAFEAGRISGRAAVNHEQYERALGIFEALGPASPRQAVQRDVDIAACLSSLGRRDEALARVQAAEAAITERPELGDGALHFGVAWVLYSLGALRPAERAVERLLALPGGLRGHDSNSTGHLLLCVGVALDRGALAEAAERLDRLSSFARRSPRFSAHAAMLDSLTRIETGRFEGLRAELLERFEAATKAGIDALVCTALTLLRRLAIAQGEPPEGLPLPRPAERSVWGDHLLLWQIIHRAHWGEVAGDPDAVRSEVSELRVLGRLAAAWIALGTGQPDAASRVAEEASALGGASGYALLETAARDAEAVAKLLSGAPAAALGESAAALVALAKERGMAPLAAEGELLALLASGETFDPARLDDLAARADAPVAARRARALLGDEVTLDHVDRAVVSAARRRLGCRIVRVTAGGGARAWGLDERTQSVWLPGRVISLVERPLLWRVLRVIAQAGGAAEKDALVMGAWEQRDYHPLRDDARLHSAVRQLRRTIEDDPAAPARLVTTEDGYAFGRAAPVRRLERWSETPG